MAKINLLEPSVYNKIAAGEVVERPASVVKELVENSIDSGATQIDISILNGGISFIEVTDNGCGIESDEIEMAFMPHATSKVKNEKDLENIMTLGFRGEALASIASVSEVVVTTRTQYAPFATCINMNAGFLFDRTQVGAPVGTQIQVKNLFFNIPVRYKFLKKPKQEEMAISEIVSRLILANPSIAFKYVVENKIVYQSNGSCLENALYSVYGSSILDKVVPVNAKSGDIEINGYIGKPTFAKPNTTYQTVVINGRYVSCKLISTAVGRVFDDYLMTRAFPFFVLHLNVPMDFVDVNVHPNKLEVKFKDQQKVFSAVNHIIDNALMRFRNAPAQNEETRQKAEQLYAPIEKKDTEEVIVTSEPKNFNQFNTAFNQQADFGVSQNESLLNEIILEQKKSCSDFDSNFGEGLNSRLSEFERLFGKVNEESFVSDNPKKEEKIEPKVVLQQNLFDGMSKNFDLLSIKIVGKIFNTFIIVEIEDKVYIIDQHAAHERILYDKLVAVLKRKEFYAQPLLIPFVLETNNVEHQFISENIDNLERLGFEVEDFGSKSFKVSTIPYNLQNIDLSSFFSEILKDMNTILSLKSEDMALDRLAQSACKHAVKGGDDLTKEEISNLLEDIARGGTQLQCPHGRPFVVELTRNDIDKWFKRVL